MQDEGKIILEARRTVIRAARRLVLRSAATAGRFPR
jgi:hypothetical protein